MVTVSGVCGALILWYLAQAVRARTCGREIDAPRFFIPVIGFWEELLWNIPGGSKRRIAHVKKLLANSSGVLVGRRRTWRCKGAYTPDQIAELTTDLLQPRYQFWFMTIGISGIGYVSGWAIAWLFT